MQIANIRKSTANTLHCKSRARRYKRAKTGCQDCRVRRVKCPEGATLSNGQKEACLNCTRGGILCWYPHSTSGVMGDQWVVACHSHSTDPTDGSNDPLSEQSRHVASAPLVEDVSHVSPATYFESIFSTSMAAMNSTLALSTLPLPSSSKSTEAQRESQTEMTDAGWIESPSSTWSSVESVLSQCDLLAPLCTVEPRRTDHRLVPPIWQRRVVRNLLQVPPTLSSTMGTASLSALAEDDLDRFAIQSFECCGCNEIVATCEPRFNWIYSLLFPRLLDLVENTSSYSSREGSKSVMKRYASHALMQLSYVHQSNIQDDAERSEEAIRRANIHRTKARAAALQLRVRHSAMEWRGEEFLMSFFVTCMADMLSSNPVRVDETTVFRLEARSTFSTSLGHLLWVYQILISLCSPPEPLSPFEVTHMDESVPLVADPREHADWVENFFGLSLTIIDLFAQVDRMIKYRIHLLRSTDADRDGRMAKLKLQTDLCIAQIGDEDGDWTRSPWLVGLEAKSRRVQRGTMVAFCALQMMLYAELLAVDLSKDQRMFRLQRTAIELVADSNIQEMAGFHLVLVIIAIYLPDLESRASVISVLRTAQRYSFGQRFRGAEDIVQQCWDIYDDSGGYLYGIAPWREGIAAAGKSLVI